MLNVVVHCSRLVTMHASQFWHSPQYHIIPLLQLLDQWFLTLLKVLSPASFICVFTELSLPFTDPFVWNRHTQCVLQDLWDWFNEPLWFDQSQVKNHWSRWSEHCETTFAVRHYLSHLPSCLFNLWAVQCNAFNFYSPALWWSFVLEMATFDQEVTCSSASFFNM